jgi:hypothetical protein
MIRHFHLTTKNTKNTKKKTALLRLAAVMCGEIAV